MTAGAGPRRAVVGSPDLAVCWRALLALVGRARVPAHPTTRGERRIPARASLARALRDGAASQRARVERATGAWAGEATALDERADRARRASSDSLTKPADVAVIAAQAV